jgi:hypothetical protein
MVQLGNLLKPMSHLKYFLVFLLISCNVATAAVSGTNASNTTYTGSNNFSSGTFYLGTTGTLIYNSGTFKFNGTQIYPNPNITSVIGTGTVGTLDFSSSTTAGTATLTLSGSITIIGGTSSSDGMTVVISPTGIPTLTGTVAGIGEWPTVGGSSAISGTLNGLTLENNLLITGTSFLGATGTTGVSMAISGSVGANLAISLGGTTGSGSLSITSTNFTVTAAGNMNVAATGTFNKVQILGGGLAIGNAFIPWDGGSPNLSLPATSGTFGLRQQTSSGTLVGGTAVIVITGSILGAGGGTAGVVQTSGTGLLTNAGRINVTTGVGSGTTTGTFDSSNALDTSTFTWYYTFP